MKKQKRSERRSGFPSLRQNANLLIPQMESEAASARKDLKSGLDESFKSLAKQSADLARAMQQAGNRGFAVILDRHGVNELQTLDAKRFAPYVRGPDGKFKELAQLVKLGPNALNLIGIIAGHAFLREIAGQLEEIHEGVDTLGELLTNLNLGGLNSVRIGLKSIDGISGPARDHKLMNFYQTITEQLAVAIENFVTHANNVPIPNGGLLPFDIDSNLDKVRKRLDKAKRAMSAIVFGLRLLVEVETMLHGHERGAKTLLQWLDAIPIEKISQIEYLARQISTETPEDRRELYWIDTQLALDEANKSASSLLKDGVTLINLE